MGKKSKKTGWWEYNPSYWQRMEIDMKFKGEKSYSNKLITEPIQPQGLFINMYGMAAK